MNYERLENGSNGLVLSASLDNLVFEGKNRSYGGYQMRSTDNRRLLGSFYFTAALVLIVTLFFYMRNNGPEMPKESFVPVMVDDPTKVVEIEVPPVDEPEKIEKPEDPGPPAPPVQEPTPTQEFRTPNPSPKAEDTATVIDQSLIIDNPGLKTDTGGGTIPMGPEPKKPGTGGTGDGTGGPTEIDINDPLYWQTEQPVAMNLNDIKGKIRYPEQLMEVGLEGQVLFKVLVDENGSYLRHEVKKTSHNLFTKEVEPKLKDLKFQPGKQAGKNVRVWVLIPFKFTLNR
jgi:protein TonB